MQWKKEYKIIFLRGKQLLACDCESQHLAALAEAPRSTACGERRDGAYKLRGKPTQTAPDECQSEYWSWMFLSRVMFYAKIGVC